MPEHQPVSKDKPAKPEKETARNPEQDGAFIQKRNSHGTRQNSLDPRLLTPAQIMNLQRTIGNAAVQRLLAGKASPVVHRQEESPARQESAASGSVPVVQRAEDGDLVQRRLWNNAPA